MRSADSLLGETNVSILVVDDAKFTCEMLRRALAGAGYRDVRVANSAREGLGMLRDRSADILLADWLMPEMDGLSLTQRVRQIDEDTNHYTYVMLLTAKEGTDSLTEAFNHGVDDFISKSHDNSELLARVRGAGRVAVLQNHLLNANRQLLELSRERERSEWFDGPTGLPNRQFLDYQMERLLRHIESRGGGGCLAMTRINQLDAIRADHGDKIAKQVINTAATRLQQSVRPLDWVTRVGDNQFALLMQQPEDTGCHPGSFRRIHQALNLRAYKTDNGFLNIGAAVSLLELPRKTGVADTDTLLSRCEEGLDVSEASSSVHMVVPLERRR
ncbi:response regulator [Ectothiorhodospiraceae bacterium WFHF3C12]|nr:response regulator [Ectothiorhodospiraceae bacterium WFHF3C12]